MQAHRFIAPSQSGFNGFRPSKITRPRQKEIRGVKRTERLLIAAAPNAPRGSGGERKARLCLSVEFHLPASIKGEVKKKHISLGWNFSCFSAHLIERDLF